MDLVTLENYRCFREKQKVRLAPITLLVGENSTGKTSFLAMIRILIQLGRGFTDFDFKEDPYDLGSFSEIAHSRGGRGGRAQEFSAGFQTLAPRRRYRSRIAQNMSVSGTFRKRGTAPALVGRRVVRDAGWMDEHLSDDDGYSAEVGTRRGQWRVQLSDSSSRRSASIGDLGFVLRRGRLRDPQGDGVQFAPIGSSPAIEEKDREEIARVEMGMFRPRMRVLSQGEPFASAPVRSKPRRTYDPARMDRDPFGDYIPMYLSDLAFQHKAEWDRLRAELGSVHIAFSRS